MKKKAITRKVLSCLAVIAILVSVVLVSAGAAVSNAGSNATVETADICPACSERPMPAGGEITKATIKASSSSSGYCPSSGGSHEYEYISTVTYTINHGGTMTITVDIYIANPSGCTYGGPCPEYDESPEYINVWIDWNGDKDFSDPGEKVIDVALTGYLGINYRGTMTTSKIVTIPQNTVNFTWMRVNLGWKNDPNTPCESSWEWGDVADKEVMVRPEIEIRGGLKQYKEDKLKDKVFRRKDDKPRFEVKALPQSGEKVEVDIFRKGNTPIKTIEAKKKSGKIYEAIWADWKSSEWSDSEIPDKIPVGEYKAKAKITKSGTELTSSDKKEFYVIFNTPSGLSDAEKKAYLYDDSKIRDEIGVWFYPDEGKRPPDNKWDGWNWPTRYYLTPFNSKVFLNSGAPRNLDGTIKVVNGETSPVTAAKLLAKHVDDNYVDDAGHEAGKIGGRYEISHMLKDNRAQCADHANLLTAYLRSVGIASHPVGIDAHPPTGIGWGFHTWTEAWIDNKWKAMDSFANGLHTPSVRLNFGQGTANPEDYDKAHNDMILVAKSNFNNNELDDVASTWNTKDVWFDFNPDNTANQGVAVPESPPLNHQKNWVEAKQITKDYWNKEYYDPRSYYSNDSTYVSTDKSVYKVGELVIINTTINNTEDTALNLSLNVTAIDKLSYKTMIPLENILYLSVEYVYVPANSNTSLIKSFNLPQDLDTTDDFYVKASYGNQTDWAFFDVLPTFNITISLPTTMIEGEEYTFNLSINNTGSETLTGVNVTLLVSPDMLELLDGESYYVGDLTVGAEASISWDVKVVGPSLGGITFKVESENGGIDYISDYVEVLTQPELDVEDEYAPFSGDFGEPFWIGFKIKNIGDLTAINVLAEITLPEDVTATETTWNIGDLAGGENVTLYTNITFTKPEDFIIGVFASDDAGHIAPGVIYVDVISNLSGNFNGMYSDYGLDTNGDGTYNYLMIEVGVNVASAGIGNIVGWLHDINGTKIAKAENSSYLSIGKHSIILKFGGFDIYKHGVSGPYDLKDLKLYNEGGMLVDSQNYAYTTTAYNYPDFQHLVALRGNYFDYGTDTDGNGLFDNLTIDVEVILASEGHCVATARLIDNNGEEIIWASHTSWLEADQSQIIQLNFDGLSINKHGVDGPYYLKDVYIYHTGDPTQPDYVHAAYTTAAYDYTDFESVFGPKAIYVPKDYPTIQAAVNAASPGNTIIVRDGTYTENVNVNKSHLTIRG